MSINSTTLTGHIGRVDKRTDEFVTFTLASDRRVRDAEGNWGNVTDWFDCNFGGRRSVSLAESGKLVKGAHVEAHGHLITQQYEKNGETRKAVKLVVEEIEFI